MKYVEARPGPALTPFIECLWMASDRIRRSPRESQRILPDGCPELIVHLADRFSRLRGGRWVPQPQAFLAGTLTHPWVVRAGRRVRTLGIRFRPGATPRVLPVRMDRATDLETSLARLVGPGRSTRLVADLRAARTTKASFDAAEGWLVEGLKGETRDSVSHRSVKAILKARGQIRIAEVAERCGATARQLERAFARDLGIRPKLFARIVRLNAFLERLGEAERDRTVDLALDAGYFDQAHLLLDFRSLTGRPPARAKETGGDLARHFTLPPRLRALFAFE
jgi:AraC-like DNA-binding protein